MAESALRGIIIFLDEIGIYDVVLPFLLVFTIMFAILEKSRIFGTEEYDGKTYTKKNLNSMTAFVVAFLVVASTRLVAVINEAMANVVLILLMIVMFLLLIGTFFKENEDVYLKGGWRTFFMISVGVAVLLIFLDALEWLGPFVDWVVHSISKAWFGAVVLILFIVLIMWLITKDNKPATKTVKEEE